MIRLRVPGLLQYRDVAVRTVAAACKLVRNSGAAVDLAESTDTRRLNLSDEFDAGMVSAFSEVFNNIAKHAYAGGPHGEVDIQMQPEPTGMLLRVEDQGVSFDISQVREPDLDTLPEQGLGIFIINSLVDEFTYEPGPPNVWTLKKRRAPESD